MLRVERPFPLPCHTFKGERDVKCVERKQYMSVMRWHVKMGTSHAFNRNDVRTTWEAYIVPQQPSWQFYRYDDSFSVTTGQLPDVLPTDHVVHCSTKSESFRRRRFYGKRVTAFASTQDVYHYSTRILVRTLLHSWIDPVSVARGPSIDIVSLSSLETSSSPQWLTASPLLLHVP